MPSKFEFSGDLPTAKFIKLNKYRRFEYLLFSAQGLFISKTDALSFERQRRLVRTQEEIRIMENAVAENTYIIVSTYVSYVILSVILTVWVAQTLHKNGRVFLVEVFGGNEPLADSVNHLLVVGFYLINFGYVSLALKLSEYPLNAAQGIEALSWKIGLVLLVLGGMHFFNLLIFNRIHRRPKFLRKPMMPESVVQA